MNITEEQALEVLKSAANARKKQALPPVRTLPGFVAQPQPPKVEQTPEQWIFDQYMATLKMLGIPVQGIGLDLRNYPIVPKEQRVGNMPTKTVKATLLRLEPLCAYCKERPSATLDHVLPKMRGGTNAQSNLVTSCLPCNNLKSAFLPRELGWKLKLPLRAFDTTEKIA